MDKVYRLLNWLEIHQAIDWLQQLTGTHITASDLLNLCDSKQCEVFVDFNSTQTGTDEDTWLYEVTGVGIQKVKNPKALINFGALVDARLDLFGSAHWKDEHGKFFRKEIEWNTSAVLLYITPIFKSSDIQALANRMNGIVTPPENELDDLREQLESASLARDVASQLLLAANADLDAARNQYMQDHEARRAEALLLEQARSEAAELKQQLEQERTIRKAAEEEIDDTKSEVEHWWKKYDLEYECRVRTQAEASELTEKISKIEAEAKPSHLLAIAGLLELLLGAERPRYNQGSISKAIHAKNWRGASETNLNHLFAAANTAAREATSEAESKAYARATTVKAKPQKSTSI